MEVGRGEGGGRGGGQEGRRGGARSRAERESVPWWATGAVQLQLALNKVVERDTTAEAPSRVDASHPHQLQPLNPRLLARLRLGPQLQGLTGTSQARAPLNGASRPWRSLLLLPRRAPRRPHLARLATRQAPGQTLPLRRRGKSQPAPPRSPSRPTQSRSCGSLASPRPSRMPTCAPPSPPTVTSHASPSTPRDPTRPPPTPTSPSAPRKRLPPPSRPSTAATRPSSLARPSTTSSAPRHPCASSTRGNTARRASFARLRRPNRRASRLHHHPRLGSPSSLNPTPARTRLLLLLLLLSLLRARRGRTAPRGRRCRVRRRRPSGARRIRRPRNA